MQSQLGEDHLVTSGIFRWLRHPNYTGEFLLWTANAAAAAAALAGAAMGPLAKARAASRPVLYHSYWPRCSPPRWSLLPPCLLGTLARAKASTCTTPTHSTILLLPQAGWLLGALIGAAGICFVLMGAAGNLEAKQAELCCLPCTSHTSPLHLLRSLVQAERYGNDPAYDDWVAGSWAGPVLRKTPAVEEVERARKLTAAAEAAAADAAAAAEGTGAAE